MKHWMKGLRPFTKVVALIAVVAVATTACSATPSTQGSGGPTGAAGQTITVAESTQGSVGVQQIPTPWMNSGDLAQSVMFRGLFRAEADLTTVKPDLAESYNVSDDAKTLTVTLKKNVNWSDGQALTADDVVWSINSILRAAQANAIYGTAFKQIVGSEVVKAGSDATMSGLTAKDNVITFSLKNPVANLLPVLAQFMILPKHSLEKVDPLKMAADAFWQKPVTSGPFKVGELSQGNFITLIPNDKYEGAKPKITKINLVTSNDPVADAKAGKIDYFTSNDADIIKAMAGVTTFSSNPVNVLFYRYFVFNLSDAGSPFADMKSREALTYGVDWNSLVKSLYPNIGTVINSGVPDGQPGHSSDIPAYTFDPAKAKALLTDANFDFTKTVRLRYYYTDQTSINLMTAVAQQLIALGMKVEVLKFQGDATTELYTTKKYDVALKGLGSFGYNEWYGEYSNSTFAKIIGPQPAFDTLNAQLNQATSAAAYQDVLTKLQSLEQADLLKLPLYSLKQYVFVGKRISGASVFANPLYLYNNNFADWSVS